MTPITPAGIAGAVGLSWPGTPADPVRNLGK